MDMVKVLIEFIVSFIIIYLFYYFFIIRKCKKDKNVIPSEVGIILSLYKIDVNKINLYQLIKIVSFTTTFIIALIVTFISLFFSSKIIIMIFGSLISVLIAIIIYRIIGRHYEKISNEKTSKN